MHNFDTGITWLNDAARRQEAQFFRDRLRRHSAWGSLDERRRRGAYRRLHQLEPVAKVELTPSMSRLDGSITEEWCTIFREKCNPETLVLCLQADLPPSLWPTFQMDGQCLQQQMAPYQERHFPAATELTHHVRAFIGTDEDLESDFATLRRAILLDPFTEHLMWGSAHASDPFPTHFWCMDDAVQDALYERARAQAVGEAPSASMRTVFSQSILTVEDHHGVFIVDIAYRPVPANPAVMKFNMRHSTDYPTDLPLDCIMPLMGLSFQNFETVRAMLRATPFQAGHCLQILSALDPMMDLQPELGTHLANDNPHQRSQLAAVAMRRGYATLLQQMAEREPDAQLRMRLRNALRELRG